MTSTTSDLDRLPALTGSAVLDPWRIRYRLWGALSAIDGTWTREHWTGPFYRLDFYLPALRLAVEVDGPSHWGREGAERDALRDAWHEARGIRTLRVSDREVLHDLRGVLVMIGQEVNARTLAAAMPEGVATTLADEVVVLSEVAPVVQAEVVRLRKACETVLPALPQAHMRLLLRMLREML